jgi:LacI family transcriptional regulator
MQALQSILKVKVPEEVSIVGGEHAGWSPLFDPPMTTVDAPLEQLARRSVDHMLEMISHRPTKPSEVLLATPIIERKSVMDRR